MGGVAANTGEVAGTVVVSGGIVLLLLLPLLLVVVVTWPEKKISQNTCIKKLYAHSKKIVHAF